ncbi:hypothetical protein CKA32_004457 [Geitlerinema sp. FC II]|nr:hypothetical protein CKA32_004457 [Geitlerinema sp. FC II]
MVVVPYEDTHYAFVAGHNYRALGLGLPGWNGKGNIGIIKDALSDNPQLVAGTRSLPEARVNGVALSGDGKTLYAAYPGLESTFVFDVEQMLATASNPSHWEDLKLKPIEELNPNIFLAGRLRTIENPATGEQRYEVDPDDPLAPLSTEGEDYSVTVASTVDVVSLNSPPSDDLTPTLTWDFEEIDEDDISEIHVFVSTFEEGEGLFPWDEVVDLSDNSVLPNLSSSEKRDLLTRDWNGYDDFNPGRILTATWRDGQWYGYDGSTPLDTPSNTATQLTLPQTLTAGQYYNWAVEAIARSGETELDIGGFDTFSGIGDRGNTPFSNVSILTHGFTLLPDNPSGIPDALAVLANDIAEKGNDGLVLRYDKPTGDWTAVDLFGQPLLDMGGLSPGDTGYMDVLGQSIRNEYIGKDKALVLLPEWSVDRESVIPDVGFSEAAADAIFASMVDLDQQLGGAVTRTDGQLSRRQGDVFNSPLHFIGFSRGTVVNSEIIQRLGTYFPQAGGFAFPEGEGENPARDLQMTTLDPHDFYQPNLKVSLPGLVETDFSDFYEPKVQVWENVTFADNYYQTVADPNSLSATPNGRSLSAFPQAEQDKDPQPAGLERLNGGQPDLEVLLGTRVGQDGRENSRLGFTRDDRLGGPHQRAFAWYAGTVDLDATQVRPDFPHVPASEEDVPIFDRLGKSEIDTVFDPEFPNPQPWYDTEGVGQGWFYSVLGGGESERPNRADAGIPVRFDNTLEASMRGDFAVPTLFNGNFEQFISERSQETRRGREFVSPVIPGWSFHNGASSTGINPIAQLVDLKDVGTLEEHLRKVGNDPSSDGYQTDYALKLGDGDKITHNRFVVPDWGVLRFDLHAPTPNGGKVEVIIKDDLSNEVKKETIFLTPADGKNTPSDVPYLTGYAKADTYRIGYGAEGFETFHVEIPQELRGKVATLEFKVEDNTQVWLDDVFFKSKHLLLGNPTFARDDENTHRENYLIERPQFAVSYNDTRKTPNWVSWQLDNSWFGSIKQGNINKPPKEFGHRFPIGFDENFPNYPDGQITPREGTFSPYAVKSDGNANSSGFKKGYPWIADSLLPENWVKVQGQDYNDNNDGNFFEFRDLDRGHVMPIADRSAHKKDAYSTYFTSNLIPQQWWINRYPWLDLEDKSRQFLRRAGNENQKLHIFAGTASYDLSREEIDPDTGRFENENFPGHADNLPGVVKNLVVYEEEKNGDRSYLRDEEGRLLTSKKVPATPPPRDPDNPDVNPVSRDWITNPKRIGVPDYIWKIIVPLEFGQSLADITEETHVIAVIMPNVDARGLQNNRFVLRNGKEIHLDSNNPPSQWSSYAVTVSDIEDLTGYEFFTGLPESVGRAIRNSGHRSFPA